MSILLILEQKSFLGKRVILPIIFLYFKFYIIEAKFDWKYNFQGWLYEGWRHQQDWRVQSNSQRRSGKIRTHKRRIRQSKLKVELPLFCTCYCLNVCVCVRVCVARGDIERVCVCKRERVCVCRREIACVNLRSPKYWDWSWQVFKLQIGFKFLGFFISGYKLTVK